MPSARRRVLARTLAFTSLLAGVRVSAEPSSSGAAPVSDTSRAAASASAPPTACVPQCRSGYFCQDGRCISMCNPPCPATEACVDGVRCEFAAGPPVDEPPPPPLQPADFSARSNSAIAFHLGFGGSVERSGVPTDLDATLGFNIREDIPVVRYLLVGPLFQFGAWRPTEPGTPTRSYYVDIDLYLRGRIPIDLDPIGLEFWGGVPIGLSLSFLGDDQSRGLESFGVGWNVGVLFGGAVHFTRKFGMLAELGWLQHRMSHDENKGSGDVAFRLSQGNFNVGFVFEN